MKLLIKNFYTEKGREKLLKQMFKKNSDSLMHWHILRNPIQVFGSF